MFSKTGDTALVLLVPEADPVVHSWRSRHDPSTAEGMLAHITVLYPFFDANEIGDRVLGDIAAICRLKQPISLTFRNFGRFPGVLWLSPDSAPCLELLSEVRLHWPNLLPYGTADLDVIPHLTITDGASDEIAAEAQADIAEHLPLEAEISALSLMVFDGTRWVTQHEFTLGREMSTSDHGPRLK